MDARTPTPRPCREEEVVKAMELARRRSRSVDAVLLRCDEDDDCAATCVAFLRTRSRSFDKLVRSIATLCGAPASPAR